MSQNRPSETSTSNRVLTWWKQAKETPNAIHVEIEKKTISDVLKRNNLSRHGFDENIYLELLPFTKLIMADIKKIPYQSQQSLARDYAAKLTILFGNAANAVAYLKRFDSNSQSSNLLHDACLFLLPSDQEWDLLLWRKLINNHNPSNPNDFVIRILPVATKIQNFFRDHDEGIRTKIATDIRNEYVDRFNKEYEEKYAGDTEKPSKEETIKAWMHGKQGEIKSKINARCGKLPPATKTTNNEKEVNRGPLNEKTPLPLLEYILNHICYENSKKNPEAAAIFFKNMMPENCFEEYLALTPQDSDAIPNVIIDGNEINSSYSDYYIKKLDPADPRAAILGIYTSCCQKMGAEGEEPTLFGITNSNAGFYVLCKKKSGKEKEDTIVAQCLAFRNDNKIVFDSIEIQLDFRNKYPVIASDFFFYLASNLVQLHGVERVSVGKSRFAGTPKTLITIDQFPPISPIDYNGYRDSHEQYLLSHKELQLLLLHFYSLMEESTKLPDHNHDNTSSKLIRSTNAVLEWCDICSSTMFPSTLIEKKFGKKVPDQQDYFDLIKPFIDQASIDFEKVEKRLQLIKRWSSYLSSLYERRSQASNEIESIKFFVMNGINLNLPVRLDSGGVTYPIFCFYDSKKIAAVKYLIEQGADLSVKDDDLTLLSKASNDCDFVIVDEILERLPAGEETNQMILNVISSTSEGMFCELFSKLTSLTEEQKISLLNDIIRYGYELEPEQDEEKIQYALEKLGLDLKDVADLVTTAAEVSRWDMVRYLITNGANPKSSDPENPIDALYYTVKQGEWDLAKELIAAGCNVNATSKTDNDTPLIIYAAKSKKWDIVRDMLVAGADINAKDPSSRNSLLQYSYQNKEMMDFIIKHGVEAPSTLSKSHTSIFDPKKPKTEPHPSETPRLTRNLDEE